MAQRRTGHLEHREFSQFSPWEWAAVQCGADPLRNIQVHLKLECRGKFIYLSNSHFYFLQFKKVLTTFVYILFNIVLARCGLNGNWK